MVGRGWWGYTNRSQREALRILVLAETPPKGPTRHARLRAGRCHRGLLRHLLTRPSKRGRASGARICGGATRGTRLRYRVVLRGDIDTPEIGAFLIRLRLEMKHLGMTEPRTSTVEAVMAEQMEVVPPRFVERGVWGDSEHHHRDRK